VIGDFMDLDKVIENRKSVRKFTNYNVTDKEIEEMMKAARWAPSWVNTQCWEFVVVRNKDLIKKVANCYKLNPAYDCSKTASVIILACAKLGKSGHLGNVPTTKFKDNWFMFDLALAVENLYLKAVDLGLGSVIVGGLNRKKLEKIIELPDGYEVVVAMPIGKPDPSYKKKRTRKELSEFVWRDRFGEY
jgi:nitroreductase